MINVSIDLYVAIYECQLPSSYMSCHWSDEAHVGSFFPLNTRENFVLVSHGGYEEGLCTLTFVLTCDSESIVELIVDIFCYGLLSLILPSSSP